MPGVEIQVRGAEELDRLARRLKEAGGTDLRKQLLKRLRESVKPVIPEIRKSAQQELPHGGGLAELIANSKLGVRTKLSGTVSVRLAATNPHNITAINAGRLRHPVFGTETWAEQQVPKGWFTKPTEKRAPVIRRDLVDVMGDIAHQITEGL